MTTTPTGIPIIDCVACGTSHPVSRRHCIMCGRPSLFITPTGECVTCTKEPA